ncbi:DeoR/GlpR family DNA-binding transcription regulator [Pontibacillus marinus]|uniref:DeoR family transcriptional regulator n=1 Tax=Pontibacillus marinus BH030004 = DSM 16465 TaxID=1385511 RepID=A0A0A5G5V1_9BACI|nr:DeoR/GlpR family DNA-binding transcription regulator [Pontibacillus marinus]KGX86513.1 DeoR family transcriptional regulator [Pontibacillus marinus BH030004 = DSM 16465]
MLTPQRHQIIINILNEQETAKIQELVDATGASEATIRRDLSQLENDNKLKRVHGGASVLHQKSEELSIPEKSTKHLDQKQLIARFAASLIREDDCIFLDAGTTTYQMIPYLKDRNITVVTNGLSLLEALMEYKVQTYLTGGFVKYKTKALVGQGAYQTLSQYRFDKCFLGVNGVHPNHGYTTPDPEEAFIKQSALSQSQEAYVLGDASKLNEVTFAKIADLSQAQFITNETQQERVSPYQEKTTVKVVTS